MLGIGGVGAGGRVLDDGSGAVTGNTLVNNTLHEYCVDKRCPA